MCKILEIKLTLIQIVIYATHLLTITCLDTLQEILITFVGLFDYRLNP